MDPKKVPPTVIVVHPRENRKKCSIEPLRGDPRFHIVTYLPTRRPELTGYLRLGMTGPVLTPADADRGLLVLDGTWRWAATMEKAYADLPVCTLPTWETAYPRKSSLGSDPPTGLATIEAIFAAYTILGRPTVGLLDHYHWRDEFLRVNHDRIR